MTDEQALAAFREVARLEGIIPALETAHALAWTLAQSDGELDLVCLSGRGDKDLAEVLGDARDLSTRPMTGVERIAEGFARATGRAALMPYLMGGYPTLAESLAIGEACVRAGADLLELGMPYSDPLADGPVIHAAGTQALAAGANVAGVLEVARGLAPSVPVVLMCYANMVLAPGAEAFVARLAQDRGVRADRARPAAGGVRGDPERVRGAWAGARAARGSHDHTRADGGDRGAGARIPVRGLGGRHHRGARGAFAVRALRGGDRAREVEHRRCRWRSALGSPRPSRRVPPPRRARTG